MRQPPPSEDRERHSPSSIMDKRPVTAIESGLRQRQNGRVVEAVKDIPSALGRTLVPLLTLLHSLVATVDD